MLIERLRTWQQNGVYQLYNEAKLELKIKEKFGNSWYSMGLIMYKRT